MPDRDIYLKIEQIAEYSPVDPEPTAAPPIQYRRDCMRNPGHEDGTIPISEVNARKLNALVYREYLDPNYLIPKPDKLILADINEPVYYHRVPGTVIYAQPGERLRIHVLNADTQPHSFHVHGLEYGIDSDGAWPFGIQNTDGLRSDEICSGQLWTYTFRITGEMLGAWPFHDHHRHVAENINRGLFGGLIVQPAGDKNRPPHTKHPPQLEKILEELRRHPFRGDPAGLAVHPGGREHEPAQGRGRRGFPGRPEFRGLEAILKHWVNFPNVHPVPRPPAILHVPLFFHVMRGTQRGAAFDSGPLVPGGPPFEVTFGAEGTFPYHCSIHTFMRATVRVAAGAMDLETVEIRDDPPRFTPAEIAVRPGGMVRWVHNGSENHTVTEDGGGGLQTHCFNGRAFVGNTPTILAEAGQRIRWYVFNLDLGMTWHNFHPHSQRWRFANENIDIRSIGPAESFVVETAAPPVLLLPVKNENGMDRKEKEKGNKGRPREYRLRGDFLFHCHVEMHMMAGMVGLVRSHETVRLTPAEADQIAARSGLPLDTGDNACPEVDPQRCEVQDMGEWRVVDGDPEVTMMHAALLPKTNKVLFWGYNRTDQTRLMDYGVEPPGFSQPANQPADVVLPGEPASERANFSNLHSAAHAYLDVDPPADGTLLAHGAETDDEIKSFLFNPNFVDPGPGRTGQWTQTADSADPRFYATTITLEDGKLLTLYGAIVGFTPISSTIEVYNPAGAGTWETSKLLPLQDSDDVVWDYIFYPWTYLLPGGDLFIAGPQRDARRFDWRTLPDSAPGTPPRPVGDPTKRWAALRTRSTIGAPQTASSVLLPLRPPDYEARILNVGGNITGAEKSAEMINLSDSPPVWRTVPDMYAERWSCAAILLPDGRVFVGGGNINTNTLALAAEIFDSDDPDAGFALGPTMTYERKYHSAAILLADGSVLAGGDPNSAHHERYLPGYFFKPRPQINAPGGVLPTINYGETFNVPTRAGDAPSIDEVVLLRPGAITHGYDMSQRFIECEILSRPAPDTVQVKAPPNDTIAPPGYYLLFIVNAGRVPSKGVWIRLTS